MDSQNNFKLKKNPQLIRAFIAFTISVVLLSLSMVGRIDNHERGYVERYFNYFFVVNKGANDIVTHVSKNFSSTQALVEENDYLQKRILYLESMAQINAHILEENSHLRSMLDLPLKNFSDFLVGQILYTAVERFSSKTVIDKGIRDGVYVGQNVLDGAGLVGRVISAGELNSNVLLINDVESNVPVQNVRTQQFYIANGNKDNISLKFVPIDAEIKIGDELITSGTANEYYAGIKVGTVSKIYVRPRSNFLEVEVTPAVAVNKLQHILLVWNDGKKRQSLTLEQQDKK